MIATLIFPLFSFVLFYYIKFYWTWRKGPPGPFPLPVLGNIWQLITQPQGTKPSARIVNISKNNADLYRMRMGVKDVVILSSVEAITDIYGREECSGRDGMSGIFKEINKATNTGISTSEGDIWKTNRSLTFKVQQKLASNKEKYEAGIHKQSNTIVSSWNKKLGNQEMIEIEVSDEILIMPIAKLVFMPLMGYKDDDENDTEIVKELVEQNLALVRHISSVSAGLDVAFPLVGKLFPNLTGRKERAPFFTLVRNCAQDLLDRTKSEMYSKNLPNAAAPSLARAYLSKMKENPTDPKFSEFHFGGIFTDILQAASETTTSVLLCILYYCVIHPEWQERMVDEISKTVNDDDVIRLEDRRRMPIMEAFILEVQRSIVLMPHLVPRRALTDFSYGNFTFQKDLVFIPDVTSAQNNARTWSNPSEFQPTRFFVPGEEVICHKKRKQSIIFGTGRRRCPGEAGAEATLFIFLVNILRTFKLGTMPGNSLHVLEFTDGALSLPGHFRMGICKR